jgi:hypothetical protein
MPATFVASLGNRLVVVSSTTGKTVRTLVSAPQAQFAVGLSPDGGTAYYSQLGPDAFDDHSGADLDVSTMDFDRRGRYLLYAVGSADPADSQVARPQTGTWRYAGDRRSSGGERITSIGPAW